MPHLRDPRKRHIIGRLARTGAEHVTRVCVQCDRDPEGEGSVSRPLESSVALSECICAVRLGFVLQLFTCPRVEVALIR